MFSPEKVSEKMLNSCVSRLLLRQKYVADYAARPMRRGNAVWLCVLTLESPNVTLLSSSVPRDTRHSTASFESAKASSVCASDNSSIKVKVTMEQWWNDTDRGKPKYREKNLYPCLFIHHKSDVD